MGRRGPTRHPEAASEAETVRILVGLEGDRVHEPPDGVVHAEVTVELLGDAIGSLGAQHHPRTALMGLQLRERGLEAPAARLEDRELGRRSVLGIEQRRDQPVALLGVRACGVVEGVLDHAHDDV